MRLQKNALPSAFDCLARRAEIYYSMSYPAPRFTVTSSQVFIRIRAEVVAHSRFERQPSMLGARCCINPDAAPYLLSVDFHRRFASLKYTCATTVATVVASADDDRGTINATTAVVVVGALSAPFLVRKLHILREECMDGVL